MKTIKPHTHEERKKVIEELIPEIKNKFGDNFVALVAEGSFARGEDSDYSDIELTVFLKDMPKEKWEIREIRDGLLIVIVANTKEAYTKDYLDVSDVWYASGAPGIMLPIVNEEFGEELNKYRPENLKEKVAKKVKEKWPHFQEITAKTLTAIKQNNKEAFPIIFHEFLKELLALMSYVNETPYVTLARYVKQARKFNIKPKNFDEILNVSVEGRYQDFEYVEKLIEEIFTDLEKMLEI